ncbi:MAG: NeuD/PglB/VioB family sugar acetyltransferase [Actinomycetota bacterium]|nr:NeuD/PglB/VioB family sugar acetyltransferase [Actinomycetota bacterium]
MDTAIVGAGGMGRETAAWIRDASPQSKVLGFVDEDDRLHGRRVGGLPVLGPLDWLRDKAVQAAVAIGAPAARQRIVDRLRVLEVPLRTVVHPSAHLGPRLGLGGGTIVCPGVIMTTDVVVCVAVIVNYGALIGHDARIGDYVLVGPGAKLAGNVTVGEGADIGIGATVLQGVTIGARCRVGAGAVVIRDVPPNMTVAGVPARVIGEA